jgi:hypothetical protein
MQRSWPPRPLSAFRPNKIVAAFLLGSLALLPSGCGSGVGATVTGLLTIDGKPAPAGVRIDFEPQVENASSSTGFTDARGEYEMRFNVNKVGVMPGESLVRVSILPEVGADGKPVVTAGLEGFKLPDSIGKNSTLRKAVKPGRNRIDIAIESDAAGGLGVPSSQTNGRAGQ